MLRIKSINNVARRAKKSSDQIHKGFRIKTSLGFCVVAERFGVFKEGISS